jgi:hypothetical protein
LKEAGDPSSSGLRQGPRPEALLRVRIIVKGEVLRNPIKDAPAAVEEESLRDYHPCTSLGKRLWELRAQIMASGERPLEWDDIEKELSQQRQQPGLEK